MNPLRLLSALAAALCLHALTTVATTVVPPTLDQLVERAASVVRTRVIATRCEWRGEGDTRRIVTVVTYAVQSTVVGQEAKTLELEYLGGELDGERMFVAGQTLFAPGHEDILFVSHEKGTVSPLVRMMYGRYLVESGLEGKSVVARSDGTPLLAADQVSAPLGTPPTGEARAAIMAAGPLSPDQFCDLVRESARRQGRTDVTPTTEPAGR